jgi:hypothetical protein
MILFSTKKLTVAAGPQNTTFYRRKMMKKKSATLTAVVLALFLCFSGVWAMSHEKADDIKSHDMKPHDMDHDQHSDMMMGESMMMLGQAEVNGVKGMAHLSDVKKQMAAMGRTETNHFMMMFSDVKTGKPIDKGVVALKVQNPAGETLPPVKLIGMGGHFGADITLTEKGKYHFLVGTKLADGVKRQYHFDYIAK